MSRVYLTLLFSVFFLSTSFSQNNVKKYIKFADEQYKKGDYYYALEYYKLALDVDSNNIDFLWKYAETLRAYKDYREAEKYYLKVYQREKTKQYPYSLLYYALMLKQNRQYSKALEVFRLAQKKYQSDENSYLYKKSKREIESCDWAIKNYIDSSNVIISALPNSVNSTNAEFPHAIKDGMIIFSSLRADSINSKEEVYSRQYRTKIYTSKMNEGKYEQNELLNLLGIENKSFGNGAFSHDGKLFYFSLCDDQNFNYQCQIWYSRFEDGKFSEAKPLGNDINYIGSNTTMPAVGFINNRQVLFFSSDRNGESQGMDLFYSYINPDGISFSNTTEIKTVNSPDGEITPWFDLSNSRLYFSSSWHNGFGGFDIFYSEVKDGSFTSPKNVGWPLNGPANDLYLFVNNDSTYFASNRIGSSFIKNPTCCSDIFSFALPVVPLDSLVDTTIITSLITKVQRNPVCLYFHNDRPNPASLDTLTDLNYLDTYTSYRELYPLYKRILSEGLNSDEALVAESEITEFFSSKIDKGVQDLEEFTQLVIIELNKGAKLKLSLRGYASPLAPTDYNVSLTKRRISSFVNYLKQYEKGVFVPYLNNIANNGGQLILEFSPYGEYKADQRTSDNPKDQRNSVFSLAASVERKIEIESLSFLNSEELFPILAPKSVFNAGAIQRGQVVGSFFTLENISKNNISLNQIYKSSENVTYEIDKNDLRSGERALVKMFVKTIDLRGLCSETITVSIDGFTENQKLTIDFEIK
ncbi:MAG: tetratricopeptide repeat protein [Bacteroidetes bacterium]|nr:tetratricopeptide repeat protein [Bacteroidota bacterium]